MVKDERNKDWDMVKVKSRRGKVKQSRGQVVSDGNNPEMIHRYLNDVNIID